jgi:homoserine kinase
MLMSTPATIYDRTIKIAVPATSANLGPGFDCLGLALNLYNEVIIKSTDELLPFHSDQETRVEIKVEGIDADKIPKDRSNLLYRAAEVIFHNANRRPARLSIGMFNRIPVGSGLGSSSSAIVAGLVGGNQVIQGGLTEDELLAMAARWKAIRIMLRQLY